MQSQIDGLVCRNKIILTVDPDFAHEHSGQVEALVTIVPSDTTRHKTLYIPVTGRLRNPEYTLKPARLALSVRQLPVTRTVRCMIASEVDDDVCLGDVPDGIRAELKKLHKGMYEVKIVCSQALPRKNMSIPILRNRDQQEACVLFLYMIP